MRIPVFLAAIIIALSMISSGCRMTLENNDFTIENLEIIWGNWEKANGYSNSILRYTSLNMMLRSLAWLGPSNTVIDDFEDGNYNGWSCRYSGGYGSLGMGYGSPPYGAYEGTRHLYFVAMTSDDDNPDTFESASIYAYYSLPSVTVSWIYISLYYRTTGDTHGLKLYVRDSSGNYYYSQTYYSLYYAYAHHNFTFTSPLTVTEIGVYAWGGSYYGAWVDGSLDYVTIKASTTISTTPITQFKVQCSSINVNGKYVKATQTSNWNTCNVTVNVYHNVDSTSTWNLAYTTTYSGVSLPYTYSNWNSGWLNLLTGSYTTGSHTYYVKLEVKARGIDLDGNIVENTAYTVLSLTLQWQACWIHPSLAFEVAEGNMTPTYSYDSMHVTAALMIIVTAIYMVFKPKPQE